MPDTQTRYSLDLKIEQGQEFLPESYIDKYQKNKVILENSIADGIEPREYQKEALGRLIYYIDEYRGKPQGNVHLMFNMATGSGKTLVLAQTILYLYSKGYRHFLFVTRLGNIVKKTIENLINTSSSKNLFKDQISINGKIVEIKQVDTFNGVNEDDINILFSTLTNLHGKLTTYKENNVTYEELTNETQKLVIIADESHNLNSYTKVKKKAGSDLIDDNLDNYDFSKLNKGDSEEFASWEGTIKKLLYTNPKNILLEFTATIPNKPEVKEKYDDKVLYQYDITKFRDDGYSKHPYTQTSSSTAIERALLGTLTSFYRQKLAESKGLFIKPVLLLKANRANLSETFDSNRDVYIKDFEVTYNQSITGFEEKDYVALKSKFGKEELYSRVFEFLDNDLEIDQIISEIKIEFGKGKVLVSSSGDDTEFKNLNTLEERTNPYRVVIAVNTLDEGWDVLNLYDIVRLYESGGGVGNNTVAEAQLIGRGVRYNPIVDPDNPGADTYKRKFEGGEYRDLETLHFHSINDSNYIKSLEKELKKLGLSESREYRFKVKDSILVSDFWQKMSLYKNELKKKDNSSKNPIQIFIETCKNRNKEPVVSSIKLSDKGSAVSILDKNEEGDDSVSRNFRPLEIVSKIIWLEAIDRVFFDTRKLQQKFPECKGREDFIYSYLNDVFIRVTSESFNLSTVEQVSIATVTLESLISIINSNTFEYEGDTRFIEHKLNDLILTEQSIFKKEEPLQISSSEEDDYIAHNTIYGTSLEIEFVKQIISLVNDKILDREHIKLIRNEQNVAIYDFDTGRPFYPDFILYHTKRQESIQFFIEPKGGHLEGDTWKEDFLKKIENRAELNNPKFKVIGLSFFKENQESNFLDELLSKI